MLLSACVSTPVSVAAEESDPVLEPITILIVESLTVAESTPAVPPASTHVTESVNTVDSVQVVPPSSALVGESVSLLDSVKVVLPVSILVVESVSVSDSVRVIPLTAVCIVIVESVCVVDSVRVTPPTNIYLVELIHIADSVRVAPPASIHVIEVVSVADSVRVAPPASINVVEVVSVTDSVRVAPPATIHVIEVVSVADWVRVTPPASIHVGESVSVVDSVRVAPPASIHVMEMVSVVDSVRITPPASIHVSESVTVNDSVRITPSPCIRITEEVSVRDSVRVTPSPCIRVVEVVNVADSVRVTPPASIRLAEVVSVDDWVGFTFGPVFTPIGDKGIDEQETLTFTAVATDPDTPLWALTFSLSGAPLGAAINPVTGAFTWTPTEAQGPGLYSFDVVVSDGSLTFSERITVTVNEANLPPVVNPIGPQTVDEEQLLTFQAIASDPDLPKNTLTFSLSGAPLGAAINPATGVFTWIPYEAQGPGLYSFYVAVWDGSLSSSTEVLVTVDEVNLPPVLDPIPIDGQTVRWDDLVTFTATATDPDLPENTLIFSLAGAPAGAAIDPTTGAFTWTPTPAQIGSYTFTVWVCDNGDPSLCDRKTCTITVSKRPTTLVYSGDASEQYSDQVTLKATLMDAGSGAPLSGKLVRFQIGSQGTTAYTDASGVAQATLILNQPSGDYQVLATFEGNDSYFRSDASADFDLNKENVGTEYTGDTFVYTAGPSISTASVVLAAYLTQEADGYPGNIQLARVTFELFASNNLTSTPNRKVENVLVDAAGRAFTTVSLSVDVWTVYVRIDTGNGYWAASPVGMGVITVDYGSTTRRVTGGGWIADSGSANGKGNFGFTVNYQKNGSPKGSSVYLYRGTDGFNYLVKSNSWQGGGLSFFKDPTVASFSGKCVVQKIDPATGQIVEAWGNYRFIVDIVDGDLLNPRAADRYAITILDSNSAVWRQIGTRSSPIQLGGGNVAIHSKG